RPGRRRRAGAPRSPCACPRCPRRGARTPPAACRPRPRGGRRALRARSWRRGLPLLLRTRTLLELLPPVGLLLGPPLGGALLRRQVGLARVLALEALALGLEDPQLLGLRLLHGAQRYPRRTYPIAGREPGG